MVPYGDLKALEEAIDETTAAVIVEPIQGEGGIRVPPEGYLRGVRELTREKGVLMIADEVQTGLGRTGKLFGVDWEGVSPDLMTLAKALAGGPPIGAMLARESLAERLGPGTHGSTFGGNPLAARVAYTVCEVLEATDLPARAGALGAAVLARFSDRLGSRPGVVDIRGKGLMIGLKCLPPNGDVVNKIGTYGVAILAREHGIPFIVAAPTSTLDLSMPSAAQIPVEERDADEVRGLSLFGRHASPDGAPVANPAFDRTPARLVTAIVTEQGVHRQPYERSLAAAWAAAAS